MQIVQELHVFFCSIAAPIYLMRTCGFRRGISLSVAHVVGILVANQAAFYAMLYRQYGTDAFAQPRF